MIRILLIVFAGGLLVAAVCLGIAGRMGPIGWNFRDHGYGGFQTTRDMGWTGSESLAVSAPADITYVQGPAAKLTVSGPKDMVDAVTLQGDNLGLGDDMSMFGWGFGRHRHWRNHAALTITVTGPSTHRFILSGAQQMSIEHFDQDALDLTSSGAADVNVQGRAKRVDVRMSGAGEIDMAALQMDDASVVISGAGHSTLGPKSSADVTISGVGNVDLLTRPPSLHTHISGIGSVTQP